MSDFPEPVSFSDLEVFLVSSLPGFPATLCFFMPDFFRIVFFLFLDDTGVLSKLLLVYFLKRGALRVSLCDCEPWKVKGSTVWEPVVVDRGSIDVSLRRNFPVELTKLPVVIFELALESTEVLRLILSADDTKVLVFWRNFSFRLVDLISEYEPGADFCTEVTVLACGNGVLF